MELIEDRISTKQANRLRIESEGFLSEIKKLLEPEPTEFSGGVLLSNLEIGQ